MIYRESLAAVNNSITTRPTRVKFEETSSSFALSLSEFTADFFQQINNNPQLAKRGCIYTKYLIKYLKNELLHNNCSYQLSKIFVTTLKSTQNKYITAIYCMSETFDFWAHWAGRAPLR